MKLRVSIFSLFFSFTSVLHAQTPDNVSWCPPGSSWTYQVYSFSNASFFQYSYLKDTVILGKNAKKLGTTKIAFVGPSNSRVVQAGANEYYYNSNDSLFWLDSGTFRFIYDFNAVPGHKWVESNSRFTCTTPGFPSNDTITVTSIRKDTIANKIYDVMLASSPGQYFQVGPVLKNIGSLVSPFPVMNEQKCCMMQNPGGACDLGSFIRLVCYSDNIRGIVPLSNPTGFSCFTITSVFEISKKQFLIYPNPVHDFIVTQGTRSNWGYTITDIQGKIIAQGIAGGDKLNVSYLPRGIYIFKILSGKNLRVSKFVKN
jgi:hypothetical protein